MSLNNRAAESKYNVKIPITGSTGILSYGSSEETPCHVETQLRVEVTGVGPTNEIQIYGRIRSSSMWHYIATVTGAVTGIADISTYDYIRYFQTVVDGTGELVASGFIFSNGGGSTVTTWGSITGLLSNQTDLNTALSAKEDVTNKVTSLASPNNTTYPTTQAVSTAIGALSAPSMQIAYNNSTSPEITTDATRGALTLKRGSAADSDNVIEIQNGAGATKFAVTGSGYTTAVNWTVQSYNTSPNNIVPVVSFQSIDSSADVDLNLGQKGAGAITAQIADNTSAGGNKRGNNAVDLQTQRNASTQVASGGFSVTLGQRNTASATAAVALGFANTSSGQSSFTAGNTNTASGNTATALGGSVTVSGNYAFGVGFSHSISGVCSVGIGQGNTTTGNNATAIGHANSVAAQEGIAIGYGGLVNSNTIGKQVYSSGYTTSQGEAQMGKTILRCQTAGAVSGKLTSDGNIVSANNQIALANQTAYSIQGHLIGKEVGTIVANCFYFEGLIVRTTNAASTTLVTSFVSNISNTYGWTHPTLTADTVNGALTINVTGVTGKTINWVAYALTMEVVG